MGRLTRRSSWRAWTLRGPLTTLLLSGIVTISARGEAAESIASGMAGARAGYVGAELSSRLGRSKANVWTPLIGMGPAVEVSLSPRWSVDVHMTYGLGLSSELPQGWWSLGSRAIWRPTDAQAFRLGLGLGALDADRVGRFDAVGPEIDAGVLLWELDADPLRMSPLVQAAFTLPDHGFFFGLGVSAQVGFGPVRTKADGLISSR